MILQQRKSRREILWIDSVLTHVTICSSVNTFSAVTFCNPSGHSSEGHSGHGMGKTIFPSGAFPVESGSNLLTMYCDRHPMQYACWDGQGRRRPNGSLVDEWADWEATRGEFVCWKTSPHMPHSGYRPPLESRLGFGTTWKGCEMEPYCKWWASGEAYQCYPSH